MRYGETDYPLGRPLAPPAGTSHGEEPGTVFVRLAASGCDIFQGHYFSRPLPEEGIGELLARDDRG